MRGCRLGDRDSSFWAWTHGIFTVSHRETNKAILFLLAHVARIALF